MRKSHDPPEWPEPYGRCSRRIDSNVACARRAARSVVSESGCCDQARWKTASTERSDVIGPSASTYGPPGGGASLTAPGPRVTSPAMDAPRAFNAAAWFVDRHVREGRAARLAISHGGRRLTYGDVAAGVNRVGNALKRLGVRMEQRVLVLLPDCPEFVYAFWGALKIGAVPIPTNTLLQSRDYAYILNDSRAEVAIVGEELAPAKDGIAIWLYTTGTTGTPKEAGQLPHDMVVCCEGYGRHVPEIGPDDRC